LPKIRKYKRIILYLRFKRAIRGIHLAEIIWCLTKGDKKIYTKDVDIVDKAMKDGLNVEILSAKQTRFIR
jgi:hypothetical protein